MSTAAGVPAAAFAGPARHLYMHVPFCRRRCDYCDFASRAVGDEAAANGALFERYVSGVAAEWRREAIAHGVERLATVYLGGGTPSLLGAERLERLLDLFEARLTPAAEITIEANPEDVDERFTTWIGARAGRAGRRRLRFSLGVQSFKSQLRVGLGRSSRADPLMAALRLADVARRGRREATGGGRESRLELSLDLMFGLPGQTMVDLEHDLKVVLEVRPDHVSWYELTLTEGTALTRRLAAEASAAARPAAGEQPAVGEWPASGERPAADVRAAMQRTIIAALGAAGYDWYEVSNYALAGRKARHNMAYWRAHSYLGFGPGAVSTVDGLRWTNDDDVAAWAAALAAGGAPPRRYERLGAGEAARERLMLAARAGIGVPVSELAAILDLEAAELLAGRGLIALRGGTIRVTRKGRAVADAVCVRLFRD